MALSGTKRPPFGLYLEVAGSSMFTCETAFLNHAACDKRKTELICQAYERKNVPACLQTEDFGGGT